MKIKEAKLSIFTDDMKIHVENVIKESRKELSELINKFSKVSGLKLNINYIFYTLVTKKPKKKSKKAIAFTVASKRKKKISLGISLTKELHVILRTIKYC